MQNKLQQQKEINTITLITKVTRKETKGEKLYIQAFCPKFLTSDKYLNLNDMNNFPNKLPTLIQHNIKYLLPVRSVFDFKYC